ncbi:MAG: hypothetical protein ACK5LZ_00935 [Anaerorhabdus sp.]
MRKLSSRNKVLIGIVIIALVLLIFAIYKAVQNTNDPLVEFTDDSSLVEGGQDKPTENADDEQIQVDIVSARVFDIDGIGFKFAIVKLRFQTEANGLNLGLDHFTTSEGIQLDEVGTYVQTLESQMYFLGKQNVWFEVVSNSNSVMVNVFVPVEDETLTEIELKTDLYAPKTLKIDLSEKTGTAEMLQYEAEDIITDGKTYQMVVSNAYEITGDTLTQTTVSGSTEYLLPSTTAVYSFNIQMISLWGDSVVIEEAQYIPDNSNETFEALDSSIQSMKHSNIIGVEVTEEDNGDLFFVAYNPVTSSISYKGVLKLKIKGESNWIAIQVDLN